MLHSLLLVIVTGILTELTYGCPCKYCGPTTLCHKMGLLEVPYTIPTKEVTRLLLYGNQITRLMSNEFQGMYTVTELDLHDNRIQDIDQNAFAGLENVESLHLSQNYVDYIPQGALLALPKLSRLFLDRNRLKKLPADIPSLPMLTRLNVGENRLTSIPWITFYTLKQLESVMLWNNPLKCDCNTHELRKWFQSSKGETVATDLQFNDCTKRKLKENCTHPKIINVSHVRNNYTSIIGDSNKQQTYVQSDAATLHCNVTGNPAPLIAWKTPSAGYVYPYSRGRMRAYENGTLYIAYLRTTDNGEYTCHPRLVDVTGIASSILKIQVVRGTVPRIIDTNEKIKGYADSDVTLQCRAIGNPDPKIEWYTPGSTERLSQRNFTGNGTIKYQRSDDGTRLIIKGFSTKDAGRWRCRASNYIGFDATYIQVLFTNHEGNLILILIITGCVVVCAIICVVVGVTCMLARKRRRQKSQNRATNERNSCRVIEGKDIKSGRPNKGYEHDNDKGDTLQQPYTQVPKVKGIRI